jgi:hypothetical protein
MLPQAKRLIDLVDERTQVCSQLTDTELAHRHGPIVWQTTRFIGQPHFYPVYRFENYYSYSLLALILKKRRFALDSRVPAVVDGPHFDYLPADLTIDREVVRLGSPHGCGYSICDVDDYAERISHALVEDMKLLEGKNVGYTNVVMCGGRDSLNLLLLPWKNDTIALSAEPNYQHVVRFVEENGLSMPVLRLDDEFDPNELDDEILECCCRAELTHWRWGASLRRLSKDMNRKLILWKGQHGDLYMSPTWKAYTRSLRGGRRLLRRVYKKSSAYMPVKMSEAVGRRLQPAVIRTAWERGASLQGSHCGFIRSIADCLTISAYHGPAMIKVLEQANLASVAQNDMRHLVGRNLVGRDVIYPQVNPAPPGSEIRRGLSRFKRFMDLIKQTGIEIRMES